MPVTSDMVAVVGQLSNLKSLQLWHSEAIVDWKPLANLTHLENLSLHATTFSNADLKHLVGLPKLIDLDLSGTTVSTAAIETLAGMKQMTNLNISGTLIEKAGYGRLKSALPNCRVVWAPSPVLQFESNSTVKFPGFMVDLSKPMTFEAYITVAEKQGPKPAGSSRTCVFAMNHIQIGWDDDQWHARYYDKDGVTHPAVAGRRTHVAGVFEPDRVRLFVDGKLVATKDWTIDANAMKRQAEFQLGFLFSGVIEEVRISNVVRYDKDFTPEARFSTDKDTLALYHLNGGPPDIVRDSSGNNRHGKIENAKWVNLEEAKNP